MVGFFDERASGSIDRYLEELAIHSDNYFNMSRRGYVYVTKSRELANDFCHLADFERFGDTDGDLTKFVDKDLCVCSMRNVLDGWTHNSWAST